MAYRKTTLVAPDYTHIPGGLNIGSQIVVRGRIPHGEEKFSINLQNEEADGCDVAFHFNPRNNEETVVRNSHQGGWQEEEREIPYFPFSYGSKFTIRIMVGPESYVVIVNNQYFIEYGHRLSYQDVRYLYLSEGAEYYEATVQNQCRTPYNGEFLRGVRDGMAVRLRGFVNDDADRFEVNFNCDQSGETVGFHFNPRQYQEDTVLNTNVGGWGEEERGFSWFPFQRGQFFDVFFLVYNNAFNIYVNEKYFTSYGFRVPLEDICYLDIKGDVVLMDVAFSDPQVNDNVKPIPSGLEKHDLISIKGFFYPEGDRFWVNFLYGLSPDDDVALHFNPRRDDDQVVLNSRDGGDWEEEERHSLPIPMKEMAPFTVEIINKEDKFKIYINGKKLASFRSQGNVEEIKGIHAGGDAYIHEVKLLRRVDNPFVDKVPHPMAAGSWVSFIGTPEGDASRFAINLQTGDSPSHDSDIALHFNPRFDEEVSVRNSLMGGEWGDEERDEPSFPFEHKDRFEVNMLVMEDRYRIETSRCQAHYASRFAMNLQTGDSPSYDSDISLHFNPRFDEEVSVRNSLMGGDWGDEERDEPSFPFEHKDRFGVNTLVIEDRYRVFVNGHRYIDFPHRIQPEAVGHVMLTGDCDFFEPEFY